jgi:hypothetical protein
LNQGVAGFSGERFSERCIVYRRGVTHTILLRVREKP